MHLSYFSAALVALHATTSLAVAVDRDVAMLDVEGVAELETRGVAPRKCGSVNPPQELLAQSAAFAAQTGPKPQAHAPIVVNSYYHVVTSSSKQGLYTQAQLNRQLTYMNNAYGSHGITFKLISSDFTVNNNWATGNYDSQMKAALRKGNYADLNLYFLSDLSGGLLGICNFPTNAPRGSSAFIQDGCDILADSLPGGSATDYNLGGTAAHETGHWFGLLHVFQGSSCSGSGDSVADTPIQSTATSGCPSSKDSCPSQAGLDNIHNYMDYSTDVCYTLFTDGQTTRMFQMWDMYRAGK